MPRARAKTPQLRIVDNHRAEGVAAHVNQIGKSLIMLL
jgi:hypothetical protein